jgi:pilus assembly protein Flp/PilA
MKNLIRAFVRDEAGLTMVEYAIAGALVAAGAATAFTDLGLAVVTRIGVLTGFVNG